MLLDVENCRRLIYLGAILRYGLIEDDTDYRYDRYFTLAHEIAVSEVSCDAIKCAELESA